MGDRWWESLIPLLNYFSVEHRMPSLLAVMARAVAEPSGARLGVMGKKSQQTASVEKESMRRPPETTLDSLEWAATGRIPAGGGREQAGGGGGRRGGNRAIW